MSLTQLLQIVNAVEQYEAKKRIPDEFSGSSFFGQFDLWQYVAITDDDRTCVHCVDFDRTVLTGDLLRSWFPDLDIVNDDQISPRVHMTLWGVDNCRCTILRVSNLADYIQYTEPIPDFPSKPWTEPTLKPPVAPQKEPEQPIITKPTTPTRQPTTTTTPAGTEDEDDADLWDLIALGLLDPKTKKRKQP